MNRLPAVLLAMAFLGCNGDGNQKGTETGAVDAALADRTSPGDNASGSDQPPSVDTAGAEDTGAPGDIGAAADAFVFDDISAANVFIYAMDSRYLKVGSADTVDVILSAPVKTKVYVLVSNSNPQVVQVSYGAQKDNSVVITFNVGQDKKSVTLKALKAGDATIKFQLYGHSMWSILSVKVVP